MSNALKQNKQNSIRFLEVTFSGAPRTAVETYVGDDFIQRNPLVADGKKGFIDYLTKIASEYPGRTIEVVSAVAERDLVALNTPDLARL